MKRIGSRPTPAQKMNIILKRARLQDRVDTFHKQAADIIQVADESIDDSPAVRRETHDDTEFDEIMEEDDDDDGPSFAEEHNPAQSSGTSSANGWAEVEYISLHLPSHFGSNWCNANGAEDLAKAELRLREGQLNDSLRDIRDTLGRKSYVFRKEVRSARSQKLKIHAWADLHAVESSVQHHARVYVRAWKALADLGAGTDLLDRYKVLRRQDLSIKTSIIAPHVRGQRNKSLAWFWTMEVERDSDLVKWMEDCTFFLSHAE